MSKTKHFVDGEDIARRRHERESKRLTREERCERRIVARHRQLPKDLKCPGCRRYIGQLNRWVISKQHTECRSCSCKRARGSRPEELKARVQIRMVPSGWSLDIMKELNGYTLKELAEKLGVTERYVNVCRSRVMLPESMWNKVPLYDKGVETQHYLLDGLRAARGRVGKVRFARVCGVGVDRLARLERGDEWVSKQDLQRVLSALTVCRQ